jgi:hypothetical protein
MRLVGWGGSWVVGGVCVADSGRQHRIGARPPRREMAAALHHPLVLFALASIGMLNYGATAFVPLAGKITPLCRGSATFTAANGASTRSRGCVGPRMQMQQQEEKQGGSGWTGTARDLGDGGVASGQGGSDGVSEVLTGANIAKAVVGAGSFALPLACKNEGLAGGILTILFAGVLASNTMKSLMESRATVEERLGIAGASYVDVAREVLGKGGSNLVFGMTMASSIGVCSAYIAFIGSTLSLISSQDGTLVNSFAPNWTPLQFEILAAAAISPVTMLRSFSFLSLTSKHDKWHTQPKQPQHPSKQRDGVQPDEHRDFCFMFGE